MSLVILLEGPVVEEEQRPTALAAVEPAVGVVGSVVRLNGQSSVDPYDSPLTYAWAFTTVPIGSRVPQEGFRRLNDSGSVVSFSPDLVGEYTVSLTVANNVYSSVPVTVSTSTRAILVPHGRGIIPDGKFVWQFISDAWSHVEGKEIFETLWSALIQICGADMLRLYQNDFNKSIRDIQSLYQRRWLSYEPNLDVTAADCTWNLGNHLSGINASTERVGAAALTSTTDTFYVPLSSKTAPLLTIAPGRLVVVGGQAGTVLRTRQVELQGMQVVLVTLDRSTLVAGQYNLAWRVPHSMRSTSQDFEQAGVSSGDRFVVDVDDLSTGLTSRVNLQVLGVCQNTLGFVLTDEPTTPGAVPEIPNSIFLRIAQDLHVATVYNPVGSPLEFLDEASLLMSTLNSVAFGRAYFNRDLGVASVLSARGRSFRIAPRSIIRNRLVPVPDELMSIPVLQSWITQPQTVERGGELFQVHNGKEYALARRPVALVENRDFTIDGETAYRGAMSFRSGSDIIESEAGCFRDRNIRTGDTFTIQSPVTLAGDYLVARVLDNHLLQLSRPVPAYALSAEVNANVWIKRTSPGRFLRFVPGGFTAKDSAPERLWAEVAFFDNNETIEKNFGILVGLTREDLEAVSASVSYRHAVAGLMYVYTRGTSIDRIRVGAQILLGLPFAEHRGIIRSLENDYRLDADGKPALGRLLIEDVGPDGAALGVMRVYTFPLEEGSKLAGVDVNPATGRLYQVGDMVELFATLSKGVEIYDYRSEPLPPGSSGKTALQQFHTVRMRANDTVFSHDELALVSSFLKKVTPSYVAFVVSSLLEEFDIITVEDSALGKTTLGTGALADNPSLRIPHALMYDGKTVGGGKFLFWDEGIFWVRRSGNDLATTEGESVGRVAGGLVYPGAGEGPVCAAGDSLVIHEGHNQGTYVISDILDTEVTVSGLAYGFLGAEDQHYSIVRKMSHIIASGTGVVTSGADSVETGLALQAMGVAPGDWLVLVSGTASWRYTISRVGGVTADSKDPPLGAGRLTLTSEVAAPSGAYAVAVVRPALIASPCPGSVSIVATGPSTRNFGELSGNLLAAAMIDAGDELRDVDEPHHRYTVLDPKQVYVVPELPTRSIQVQLCKRGVQWSPLSLDHVSLTNPADEVLLKLSESDPSAAVCTSGDTAVLLQMRRSASDGGNPPRALEPFDPAAYGILPGDTLLLTTGGNSSVDVGYGGGIFPIVGVDSVSVQLASPLTSSDSSAWMVLRRR